MKQSLRRLLLLFLTAIFIGSCALILRQLSDFDAADEIYDEASSIAAPPASSSFISVSEPESPPVESPPDASASAPLEAPSPDEEALTLMDLDLAVLRQVNDKVLGWIHIPDSAIDYPLLQVSDNNEYLRRAWDGTKNNVGCIFLECSNQSDFSDLHTLIYGHYMQNGTMFGSLHYYKEQEYWQAHPYIYIVTDEAIRRYQVFSTYEADITSDTYRIFPERNQRWQTALDYYIDSSVMDSELLPSAEDYILTLSTCTGTGTYHSRWVVQAFLDEVYPRNSQTESAEPTSSTLFHA